jgi:hypothetical protein
MSVNHLPPPPPQAPLLCDPRARRGERRRGRGVERVVPMDLCIVTEGKAKEELGEAVERSQAWRGGVVRLV